MKRIAAIAMMALLVFALVGCGGDGGKTADSGQGGAAPAVVDGEQAKEAFIISFVSVISASFAAAFGEDVPGVTLDPETQDLKLDNFSLQDMYGEDVEVSYTSVSGTVTGSEEATTVDVTLVGGPVSSISYSITPEMMQSEGGFTISVTVNGVTAEVEITPEDMEGE